MVDLRQRGVCKEESTFISLSIESQLQHQIERHATFWWWSLSTSESQKTQHKTVHIKRLTNQISHSHIVVKHYFIKHIIKHMMMMRRSRHVLMCDLIVQNKEESSVGSAYGWSEWRIWVL